MLKRLVIGVVEGLALGAVMALVVIKLLGMTTFGGIVAYLFAIAVGLLAGLFAGKPIWARDAKIEAGLKALVGAGLAAGLLWALRRWGGTHVDLRAFEAGSGALGELPAVALPLIATALSVLFELDNTGDAQAQTQPGKARVSADASAGMVEELDEQTELEAPERRARKG